MRSVAGVIVRFLERRQEAGEASALDVGRERTARTQIAVDLRGFERAEDAAARELREELGLDGIVAEAIGIDLRAYQWMAFVLVGALAGVMGVGGGFLLVPMLIYFLRVPTATVIGTSMLLTLITMASATVMHAATNHLVDAVLSLILMIGGVIGAQFGARAGQNMRGERLRLLLGLLVLCVCLRFLYQLVVVPDDLYSIRFGAGL